MMKKTQKLTTLKNFASNSFFASLFLFSISSAFGFEYQSYELKIKNNYAIRNIIEKMPRSDLEKRLREFVASGRPNRLVGTSGHKDAQKFLMEKLKAHNSSGVIFNQMEFDGIVENKSQRGINYIWEKKGKTSPNEVIILTANYDTLLKDPKTNKLILTGQMPGADNNGSGVSILLSMMEILDKLELPKTVKLVFLDMGEFSSQGAKFYSTSKEFQSEIGTKKIIGVINLSMLGHDSRVSDKEKKMNNMNLYAAQDLVFANSLIKSGQENYNTVAFDLAQATEQSKLPMDSQLFRNVGLSAVTFSHNREGDLNPRYMTSNDFVETLNINTYSNVFKYLTSAVLAWNYDVVK